MTKVRSFHLRLILFYVERGILLIAEDGARQKAINKMKATVKPTKDLTIVDT